MNKELIEFEAKGYNSEHELVTVNIMAKNKKQAYRKLAAFGFSTNKLYGPNDKRPQATTKQHA
jgi:hypothetical protein